MAGKKLEVGIGADVSDFQKKIKEVEFDLKELSKAKVERIKLGLDTGEINNQIKDVKKTLNDLKTTTRDTGNAFNSMAPKVANGGAALTSFSRIAQDAPYGIIGVGNNITNTAEQFGYLVKETGSAGGAIKAMLSSLAGVGGVLLGVSLLTTGLTLMAQQGLTVSDVIDKMTGKFDEFGNKVNQTRVEAAKSSGEEIANVKALISVAQDENKTRRDRLTAVDELQSKYPAYFGNLTKEQILTGDLTKATESLTKAIIARAEASALSEKIGEIASKLLEARIKREKAILDLQKAQQAVKNKEQGNNFSGVGVSTQGMLQSALIGDLANKTKAVKELNQEIYDLKLEQNKLAEKYNKNISDSIPLEEKSAKIQKDKVEKFKNPKGVIDKGKIFTAGGVINPNLGLQTPDLGVDEAAINAQEKLKQSLEAQRLLLENFNKDASSIINDSIASTFSQLGQAIGSAFTTGGNVLEAVGKTLLSSLGAILVDLGKLAIKTGVGILAVKTALKTLNPYVAIAAGVGLVAIGSAFSAGANKIGGSIGSNGGGGSGVSTRGGSNSSFSSSSGGFSSGGFGGNVVFEISGQKLIGVLNNTLNGNKRLGGAVGLG